MDSRTAGRYPDRAMGRPLDKLEADELRRFDGESQRFEEFCFHLIRWEVEKRFGGKKFARVYPPTGKHSKDGGRDIRVEVKSAPRIPSHDYPGSLVEDDIGTTWFSCKAGENWFKLAQRDCGLPQHGARDGGSRHGQDKTGPLCAGAHDRGRNTGRETDSIHV